ncbi:MAG: hypothetical protein ACRCX2_27120 [Paraclostridium sp.]
MNNISFKELEEKLLDVNQMNYWHHGKKAILLFNDLKVWHVGMSRANFNELSRMWSLKKSEFFKVSDNHQRSGRKLKTLDWSKLPKMYNRGATTQEIANEVGCALGTVVIKIRSLKYEGVLTERIVGFFREKHMMDELLKLSKTKNLEELAEHFGCHRSTIRLTLQKYRQLNCSPVANIGGNNDNNDKK